MFPSLLPHTTRSTIETAPKLVDFCVCKSYFKNVVNSGATSLCGQILNYKNHQTPHGLPFTENSRSTYVSFENKCISTMYGHIRLFMWQNIKYSILASLWLPPIMLR